MNNISQFSRDRAAGAGRSGALAGKLDKAASYHDAGQLRHEENLCRDIHSKDPACAPNRYSLDVRALQTGQFEAALKLIDFADVVEPPEFWHWGHDGQHVPFFPNTWAYRRAQSQNWTVLLLWLVEDLARDVREISTSNLEGGTF